MITNNKLELLAMAKGFSVEKFTDGWEVTHNDSPLMAFINEYGNIEYYRQDVRNTIHDVVSIDMERLLELKNLCEELIK